MMARSFTRYLKQEESILHEERMATAKEVIRVLSSKVGVIARLSSKNRHAIGQAVADSLPELEAIFKRSQDGSDV
jgi:hypothetical protein